MTKSVEATVTEPVIDLDRRVREAMLPYRETPPAKAIGWLSGVGDQTPLRVISAGTVVAGLLRRDPRMAAAGVRMLLAHEVATGVKRYLKHRVIRERPRSSHGKSPRPRKGRDLSKEKSSFPSGHSAGSAAVAVAVAGAYPEHAAAAGAAAAAVALGRIPGCAHYPSDIAVGSAIGASAGGLVDLAWRWAAKRFAARDR